MHELSRQPQDDPVIITRDLRKTYGRFVALQGVDLAIPRAAVGLLGPNGAGKSTLIKLLLGIHKPTGGTASLLGVDIRQATPALRQRVGYMPEDDCLPLDVTAADFVGHMAQISGLPAKEARLRAAEMLYHCGVDQERYRRLREFSSGMKQRVKLAQAIVHDPELIFLDEPTNGMDPAGREAMLCLIARLHRELGATIILSSHVLEDLEQVCDYVVMLDLGRLAVAGFVDELIEGLNEVVVEIDGDVDAFAARVSAAGLPVSRRDSELVIGYRGEDVFDLIRDSAADLGIAMRSLHVSTRSLEEVYIRQVAAGDGRAGTDVRFSG